jgi:alkylhydroperoxidase family enzyme
VQSVLDDYRTAPISSAERVLLGLIEKVTRRSQEVTLEDIALSQAAGWSDEAIYDALTVCALFHFYNKWVDGTGVAEMPESAYIASGHRLATRGYSA